MYNLTSRATVELFGPFWLVFGGCGSAVLAAQFITPVEDTPINLGIGLVGVPLAFGLTVLTMAYEIGHISGCHLNPAGQHRADGRWTIQGCGVGALRYR